MDQLEFKNPGGLQSKPDYRANLIASAVAGNSATPTPTLPPSLFTNFERFGYYDQQKTPSCVSHAVANLMKLWWFMKTGEVVRFSPRFLHVMSKTGYGPNDGRDPVSVLKIAQKYGCATELTCPNDTSLDNATYVGIPITQSMLDEAIQRKIPGYVMIPPTQYGIRAAIQQYGAVAMLFQISNAFWTAPDGTSSWAQDKIDPVRAPKSIFDVISGHEIVGSGYNTSLDHFVNSWGNNWAEHGESDYLFNEWEKWITEAVAIAEVPGDAINLVRMLPPADEFKHNFTQTIGYGSQGDEVRALQIALSIDGENPYPEVTGFYGDKTRQAVLAFQSKYQVAPQATINILNGRNVGPATRAQLNKLFNN